VVSSLEVLGNSREISSQFHLEQAVVGKWSSKAMIISKHLASTLSHKCMDDGIQMSKCTHVILALEWVLRYSDDGSQETMGCTDHPNFTNECELGYQEFWARVSW
jgi:hypothetical protein